MELTELYTVQISHPLTDIPGHMKVMEDAGLDHMAQCGHRLEDMWAQGESMMFSRSAIHFHSADCPDRVDTRIVACKGVRAQRYFWFYAGEKLTAEGMNESFCVKMDTHQVFRCDWFRVKCPPFAGAVALRRLTADGDLGAPIAECTVDPADVDYNGHLHNTRYWDYALTAFGDGVRPREMQVQFLREILPDSPFTLHRMDAQTVAGRQHGAAAFVAWRSL